MHVLVTRPREDAEPLVAELAERGHTALVEPMLHVRMRTHAPVDLTGVQGLLFTSANGVRALARLTERRDVRAFAVGGATAATACEHGFSDVVTADGNADALANTVRAHARPADGALYHAAGTVTRGALAETLDAAGYTVRRETLYAAEPVAGLSENACAALRGSSLDAVLFFSPRTADTFVSVVGTTNLAAACRNLDAVCLSPAVAERARALPWRAVRVAARPERSALLAALADPAVSREASQGL